MQCSGVSTVRLLLGGKANLDKGSMIAIHLAATFWFHNLFLAKVLALVNVNCIYCCYTYVVVHCGISISHSFLQSCMHANFSFQMVFQAQSIQLPRAHLFYYHHDSSLGILSTSCANNLLWSLINSWLYQRMHNPVISLRKQQAKLVDATSSAAVLFCIVSGTLKSVVYSLTGGGGRRLLRLLHRWDASEVTQERLVMSIKKFWTNGDDTLAMTGLELSNYAKEEEVMAIEVRRSEKRMTNKLFSPSLFSTSGGSSWPLPSSDTCY